MAKNNIFYLFFLSLGVFVASSQLHAMERPVVGQCAVCTEPAAYEAASFRYPCGHRVCLECLKETFINQIEVGEQEVAIEGYPHHTTYSFARRNYNCCPVCRTPMPPETAEALLGDLEVLYGVLFNHQTALHFIETHPHEYDNPQEIYDLQMKTVELQSRYEAF